MKDDMFSKTIRVSAGIVFLVVAAIWDIAVGYSYEYNSTVSFFAVIGTLSLLSAIFAVKYIPYLVMNFVAYILSLLVISRKDSLGSLFAILFLVIIFIAMWVVGMLISEKRTPVGKILGSLIANIVTIIVVSVVIVLIVVISLAMLW